MRRGPVVVLAGGTGGAKLSRGLMEIVGPENLVVVANTGDDIEIYGGYVCPDPDLVTFWLADRIDDRGWGLRDDTFHVMDGLRALGVEVWFNVGDRDLAIALERARALNAGTRLTVAHASVVSSLDVRARVLPMSDLPVRTRVMAGDRWWPFQEFMIKGGGRGPVQDVDFHGARVAHATPEVVAALSEASLIVIGPSNPIASIGPILALEDLAAALAAAPAPRLAVSPLVAGQVLKGPTAEFMAWAGRPVDNAGVASLYAGMIDGMVADGDLAGIATAVGSVLMDDGAARRRVAERVLELAETIGPSPKRQPIQSR